MDALCGNVIELEDGRGHPVLALSSQSYHAFTGGCSSIVCAMQMASWIGKAQSISAEIACECSAPDSDSPDCR